MIRQTLMKCWASERTREQCMRDSAALIIALVLTVVAVEQLISRETQKYCASIKSVCQRGLDTRVELQVHEEPLSAVLARVAGKAGIVIEADWTALAREGVNRDVAITARLCSIRARKAIEILLDSVTATTGCRLGYFMREDGHIVIEGPAETPTRALLRVYDVRDLASAHCDVEIENLVMDAVAPETWKSRGGRWGACKVCGGQVPVIQPPEYQRQVVNFLEVRRERQLATRQATNWRKVRTEVE
jgi:hypothetical protein